MCTWHHAAVTLPSSTELVACLAACFEASPDGVIAFGPERAHLYENAAARRQRALFDANASELGAAVDAALHSRTSTRVEWGDVGPGGVRAWFDCSISPVRGGDDAVVAALAISKDVTESKRTEARLRRSEQLMVDTQGVAHLGTWEWDVTEPNATWSAELYRIYGLTPETYTPSYEAYLTKIHPDDRQRVIDATNRVFHEHVAYSHDERIFRPDGTMRYLHTWAFPVLDDDGKLRKLVGVCQDITDRKEAEAEVLRLNESLERRVADRTLTIERSMRDLEAFQAMVSHDLRAPLSVISGSCTLLEYERDQLPASATPNVDRIRRAATQMTRLVNDLLTLAHVGNSPLEVTDVDLTATCEDVVAQLRLSSPTGPTVRVSIEPGMRCRGDGVLVRTVLENLVGNAWKYSSKVEAPAIEVGAVDGSAFFVRDNGVGFDMKEADRLFAPFQRLHTASEFVGTGVGLTAVHRIVERHGGRIWAESAPGAGATFWFTLGGPGSPDANERIASGMDDPR